MAACGLLGAECGGAAGPPLLSATLNAVDDDLNDLLVVPPGDFAIQVSMTPGNAPLFLWTFGAFLQRWGDEEIISLDSFFQVSQTGALALIPPGTNLAEGTYVLRAHVQDDRGVVGWTELSFAVRAHQAGPPIGSGQNIWLDFESDRDATPGPDFPVDLETFGLASPAAPTLSQWVREDVVDAILARVSVAYHFQDPNGFGFPDAVDVVFLSHDPGVGDVTRICIGGADPSGQYTIGSILIDPKNGNRNSIECGTIPPTGIFPRELSYYQSQTEFKNAFDPLRASAGGTPVGEHPLDAVVLAEGFDPGSASPEELARYDQVSNAVQIFADALGTIVAHEAGHALGLVAPGPPGGGLHGGQVDEVFTHDITSSGADPAPNYLMKRGGTFNFAKLAGLSGHTLAYFRPLDHAYLRDRVVLDSRVSALLWPPEVVSIVPSTLTASTLVTVTGADLAATPSLSFQNESFTYQLIGEAWVSSSEVTAWALPVQIPAGVYDLVLENPDGQATTLPAAVTVP